MAKQIAILVPVFNNISFTKSCLEELSKAAQEVKDDFSYQIIIIDDGSTDGTAEYISENYPDVIILKGDGNLWWSGSVNLGMQYIAEHPEIDYIVWWNNDIEASKNYFHDIPKLLEKLDTKTIIGSKIYEKGTNIVWSMGGVFNAKTGKRHQTGLNEEDSETYEKAYDAQWLPGMGSVFHRSVLDDIGMLDAENFPQYHGDIDYTLRATNAGYKITVFPELKIWNDRTNTGLTHQGKWKQFKATLTSNKSIYNLKQDIVFIKNLRIRLLPILTCFANTLYLWVASLNGKF
jgi:GT2 family glycosyltransferase